MAILQPSLSKRNLCIWMKVHAFELHTFEGFVTGLDEFYVKGQTVNGWI